MSVPTTAAGQGSWNIDPFVRRQKDAWLLRPAAGQKDFSMKIR